jgi:hypothetical protein
MAKDADYSGSDNDAAYTAAGGAVSRPCPTCHYLAPPIITLHHLFSHLVKIRETRD